MRCSVYLISLSFLLFILLGCERNRPLEADITLENGYYKFESESYIIDFDIEANKKLSFVEAKIMNEENVNISEIQTISSDSKSLSGQINLNILYPENQYDGEYSFKITLSTGDQSIHEYKTIQINFGQTRKQGILFSDVTFGESKIKIYDPDSGVQIIKSYPYECKILHANSLSYGLGVTYNQNKIYEYLNGSGISFNIEDESSYPEANYFGDGVQERDGSYITTANGYIHFISNSGIKTDARREFSRRYHAVTINDDYLVASSQSLNGQSNQINIINKITLAAIHDFIVFEKILDIIPYEDNKFLAISATSLYEFDVDNFNLSQQTLFSDLESIGGIYNGQVILNTNDSHYLYNLSSGQSSGLQPLRLEYMDAKDWLVYISNDYFTIQSATNQESISTIQAEGRINNIKAFF